MVSPALVWKVCEKVYESDRQVSQSDTPVAALSALSSQLLLKNLLGNQLVSRSNSVVVFDQ